MANAYEEEHLDLFENMSSIEISSWSPGVDMVTRSVEDISLKGKLETPKETSIDVFSNQHHEVSQVPEAFIEAKYDVVPQLMENGNYVITLPPQDEAENCYKTTIETQPLKRDCKFR